MLIIKPNLVIRKKTSFRARWLLPEDKSDEPELAPLGWDHIVFPIMFLGGGLGTGLLSFILGATLT